MDAKTMRDYLAEANTHASALLTSGCDPNELGKAIRLLIALRDIDRVIGVLDVLARDHDAHHSRQTQGYVSTVLSVMRNVKGKCQGNVNRAIQILGWTHRKLRAKTAKSRAMGGPPGGGYGGPRKQQFGGQGGYRGPRR